MTPSAIIRKAASAGVALLLTPTGTLKASGDSDLVSKWTPVIRVHKADIVAALKGSIDDLMSPRSDAQPVERINVTICKSSRTSKKLEHDYCEKRSTNRFLMLVPNTLIPIGNCATWYEEIVINIRNIKRIHVNPYMEALADGCGCIGGPKMEYLPPDKYRCAGVRLTLKRPTYALLQTLSLMSPRLYHFESIAIANRIETISSWDAEKLADFLRTHAIHRSQVPTKRGVDLDSQIARLLSPDSDTPVRLDFRVTESSSNSGNPAVITLMTFQSCDAMKSAGINKFGDIDRINLREVWQREMLLRSTTFETFDEVITAIRSKYEQESISNDGREKTEQMIQELAEKYTTPLPTNPCERYINGRQQKALQFEFYKGGRDLLKQLDNTSLLPCIHIDNADLLPGGEYYRDEVSDDDSDET